MASLNDLFVSYKAVAPSESETPAYEAPTYLDQLEQARERTASLETPTTQDSQDTKATDNEPEYNWWVQNRPKSFFDDVTQDNVTVPYAAPSRYNRGKLAEELKALLDKEGIHVRVTSGKRPAGAAGKAGSKSNHVHGNAADIVPAEGETFETLRKKMSSNPRVRQFFYENGLGVIDETIAENMAKTGATGKHFHVGPDSWATKTWSSWTNGWKPTVDSKKEWSVNLYNAYVQGLKQQYGKRYSDSDYRKIAKYMTYQSALESGYGEHANGFNYGGHMSGGKTIHYNTLNDFVKAHIKTLSKWDIMSATSLKDYVNRLYQGQYLYNPSQTSSQYFASIDGTRGRVNGYLGVSMHFGGKFSKIRQIYEDSFS